MPAYALHLIGAGLHSDRRVDGRLVQGVPVEAGHTANSYRCVTQMMVRLWGLFFEGLKSREWGCPGIQACTFKTIKTLELDRVIIKSAI